MIEYRRSIGKCEEYSPGHGAGKLAHGGNEGLMGWGVIGPSFGAHELRLHLVISLWNEENKGNTLRMNGTSKNLIVLLCQSVPQALGRSKTSQKLLPSS